MVPVSRLFRRLRQPRSVARDLGELRRRLALAAGAGEPGREERAAAARLRSLRQELVASFGAVRACAGCAAGLPGPAGRFDGGHCCGGVTGDVFTDEEVAALAVGGTRPRDMRTPISESAGCAFRGQAGCSLAAADRPNVCVRYMCRPLSRELFDRGDLDGAEALIEEMEAVFARFRELHAERLLDQEWAALVPQGSV